MPQMIHMSKHFVATIKMVAYRAETSMANLLRPEMSRPDKARHLVRTLFQSEADLIADYEKQTLTVRLHNAAQIDQVLRKLCDELNATETLFPRTSLRLFYVLGSDQDPGGQDV